MGSSFFNYLSEAAENCSEGIQEGLNIIKVYYISFVLKSTLNVWIVYSTLQKKKRGCLEQPVCFQSAGGFITFCLRFSFQCYHPYEVTLREK